MQLQKQLKIQVAIPPVAVTAVPADTPVLHILTLMHSYKGKVLLIVNTATGCGFTPHYKPLEEMYKDLKNKGFEILDFPCNQFANQAPGSEEEIHNFCTLKFGTDFPQFAKIDVNGENADPLFAFIATEKP